MTQIQATLIDALKQKQEALGLTDGQFAEQLGVTRPMWASVRDGRFNAGPKFLGGVLRAFPDLQGVVLAFLVP